VGKSSLLKVEIEGTLKFARIMAIRTRGGLEGREKRRTLNRLSLGKREIVTRATVVKKVRGGRKEVLKEPG